MMSMMMMVGGQRPPPLIPHMGAEDGHGEESNRPGEESKQNEGEGKSEE
jgi:hypothetical protein